ncbi:transglycosylase family protein [Mycobacterium talmoniae]|uniref:Resuscitation-promoting n=1 Tax=Mycobacterium talmoniae TaxID=1858794 RepID=A0A1S1NJT2_9MYCO|nr:MULTISPECIES: transglycosylase family protein [Mycobacterium]OHV04109.1 resuscitation-promoting [Mycobacterium talmoniae]PQM47354.1 Resuscitation-promoting factor RpfC [Mycobacterium talmoniae]TDH52674.1 resuscitation-promoting [Mycobacterium eburneum]
MQRKVRFRRVVRPKRRRRSLARSGLLAGGVAALLGPSAAVAHADSVNWDAVAQCESGGNWSADTGNGFYGGLQFRESTWREFGGVGSPADAPRDEQIAVANRVLAVQGPEAWPRCGPGMIPDIPVWRPFRTVVKTIWGWVPH